MVIWKIPVHFREELRDLAAQAPEQARRNDPGDTIAAVHRDLERPRKLHVAGNAIHVGIENVCRSPLAGARLVAPALHPLAQVLDLVAGQGKPCDQRAFRIALYARATGSHAVYAGTGADGSG